MIRNKGLTNSSLIPQKYTGDIMLPYRFSAFSLLLATTTLTVAQAAETPYGDALLGDWGGVRSTLADRGVEVRWTIQRMFGAMRPAVSRKAIATLITLT